MFGNEKFENLKNGSATFVYAVAGLIVAMFAQMVGQENQFYGMLILTVGVSSFFAVCGLSETLRLSVPKKNSVPAVMKVVGGEVIMFAVTETRKMRERANTFLVLAAVVTVGLLALDIIYNNPNNTFDVFALNAVVLSALVGSLVIYIRSFCEAFGFFCEKKVYYTFSIEDRDCEIVIDRDDGFEEICDAVDTIEKVAAQFNSDQEEIVFMGKAFFENPEKIKMK